MAPVKRKDKVASINLRKYNALKMMEVAICSCMTCLYSMSEAFILVVAATNVDPLSLGVSGKSKVEFEDLNEGTRGQASTSLRSTFICRNQPLALIRHLW